MVHLIDSRKSEALEKLRSVSAKNIVFGAGVVGELAAKACEKLQISIHAYCDNSQAKQGQSVYGIPIFSPEEIAANCPHANVILALTDPVVLSTVVKKMRLFGFTDYFSIHFIDSVSADTLYVRNALRAHDNFTGGEDKLIISTSMHITDRCTLRCADCGGFVPFLKERETVPTESVIRDIDSLCMCVDALMRLDFIGGETFLHPEWPKLLAYAADQSKVHSIHITTNGTIMPSDAQLEPLINEKITISISDYGGLSPYALKISERLDKLGIKHVCTKWTKWWAFMAEEKAGRDPAALQKHFLDCFFCACTMTYDGKIYRCGTLLNGVKAGFFPDVSGDCIELGVMNDQDAIAQMREKIRYFLFEKTDVQACDFCKGGGPSNSAVPAARQVTKYGLAR